MKPHYRSLPDGDEALPGPHGLTSEGNIGGNPELDLTLAGLGAFGTDKDMGNSLLLANSTTNYRVVTYTSDIRFAGTDAHV